MTTHPSSPTAVANVSRRPYRSLAHVSVSSGEACSRSVVEDLCFLDIEVLADCVAHRLRHGVRLSLLVASLGKKKKAREVVAPRAFGIVRWLYSSQALVIFRTSVGTGATGASIQEQQQQAAAKERLTMNV